MRRTSQCHVPPIHCCRRSIRGLDEACLTEDRLRLDRLPATARRNFLTPAGCAVIPLELTKLRLAALHCIAALWVRFDRLRSLRQPSRPQWRGPKHQKGT